MEYLNKYFELIKPPSDTFTLTISENTIILNPEYIHDTSELKRLYGESPVVKLIVDNDLYSFNHRDGASRWTLNDVDVTGSVVRHIFDNYLYNWKSVKKIKSFRRTSFSKKVDRVLSFHSSNDYREKLIHLYDKYGDANANKVLIAHVFEEFINSMAGDMK